MLHVTLCAMKHAAHLPEIVAHAAKVEAARHGNDACPHPPLFVSALVLTPLLWPIGLCVGMAYFTVRGWRAAGAAMMAFAAVCGALWMMVVMIAR